MMKLSGPLVVIDDDKDDRELLLEVLSTIGIKHDVRMFEDCSSALAYLELTKESPFLILCDINLPMMNGLEFRRILNSNEYLRKKSIPFVFLSTAATPTQVNEAYDLTVQGFFVKQSSIIDMQKDLVRILEYWKCCVHPNTMRT
jgi:CheY-like chemotaxis protein